MCGSDMKATMSAHDLVLAGSNRIMVTGSMESTSSPPYLLTKARAAYWLGLRLLLQTPHGECLIESGMRGPGRASLPCIPMFCESRQNSTLTVS